MTPTDRVREIIKADPRTRAEKSRATGKSEAYLYQIETGRVAKLQLETADEILRGLGHKLTIG